MNNKNIEHSKRLLKTRQEFSQLTKSEVNKWKRIKQIKDNKLLEELQKQEIDRIDKELIDLRQEYKRIASERGSAHKWAQIVAKHETDANEFDERRNAEVLKRSKHKLNHFIDENNVKQNNIQIEKQNQILRRKQLMKSSVTKEDNDYRELVRLLKRLNDLKKSESILNEVIEKKKDLISCQKSCQKSEVKPNSPKKLIPKQKDFESKVLNQMFNRKQTNFKPLDKKQKPILKTTEVLKIDSISDKSDEYLPISIATKLYHKLRTHPKQTQRLPIVNKLYRNVAINTNITPSNVSLETNSESDHLERNSIDNWSNQTSYLAVPTTPHKTSLPLTQIYKNLSNRLNNSEDKYSVPSIDLENQTLPEITVADHSVDTLDPLMIRINNLKQLIDRKVGQKSTLQAIDLNPNFAKLDLLKDTNNKENKNDSKSKVLDNSDAISSCSSASFKTLQAISSSDHSSVHSVDSSLQVIDILNNDFPSIGSNVHSIECLSNGIQSNSSSFISSEPLRDRNLFWKDIFERAGIDIDINRIDELFPSVRPESVNEPTVDTFASFTLSSFSTDPNSHSTPKH